MAWMWYPDHCLEEDENGKCIKLEPHGKVQSHGARAAMHRRPRKQQ